MLRQQGIKDNEILDRLAKIVVRKNFTDPELVVDISSRLVNVEISSWLTGKHQKKWNEAASCRQVKALMGTNLNPKREVEICKLGTNEFKVLTGLFTGHESLGYNRHKIGLRIL